MVADEGATNVIEGLEALAPGPRPAAAVIMAPDKEGIAASRRLRVHHLRGSSALAYGADVVLIIWRQVPHGPRDT